MQTNHPTTIIIYLGLFTGKKGLIWHGALPPRFTEIRTAMGSELQTADLQRNLFHSGILSPQLPCTGMQQELGWVEIDERGKMEARGRRGRCSRCRRGAGKGPRLPPGWAANEADPGPLRHPRSALSLQPFVSPARGAGARERAPRRAHARRGGFRVGPRAGIGCCSLWLRP